MKHIVYILDSLTVVGGIGRVVTLKANWLCRHGYRVTLMVTEGDTSECFYDLEPEVEILPLGVHFLRVYNNGRGLLGMLKSGIARQRASRRFRQRVGAYLTAHRVAAVFLTGNHPEILSLRDGSRKYFETHFSIYGMQWFRQTLSPLSRWLYDLHNARQQRALRRYDRIVLLTRRDVELRHHPANAIVIPNPITTPPPAAAPAYGARRVIAVGRLDPPKNYECLLEAWQLVRRQCPDWQLHIYGHSYGREAYFQRLISEGGLTDCVFIHPPVQDIVAEYLRSSFLVMSSRFEGFPLVLGEAMACGLPCVAFDCNCGPADIIRDADDGYLISPVGNAEALAAGIVRMMRHPRLEEMGQRARSNIQRFGVDRVMQCWVDLIETGNVEEAISYSNGNQ